MATDLKQIARLFNDCIEIIRSENCDNLEEMAAQWLKSTRYQVMRQVEAEYYKLAKSRGQPAMQQDWALDPTRHLSIFTQRRPPILRPYCSAIQANLKKLMEDCGFNATVWHVPLNDFYCIQLRFPHHITNHSCIPDTLQIEDQFSNPGTGVAGGFLKMLTAHNDDQAEGSE